MNKSLNFQKNYKLKNENNSKANKLIIENEKKFNNSMIKSNNDKDNIDLKKLKLKNFLNDRDSESELENQIKISPYKKGLSNIISKKK